MNDERATQTSGLANNVFNQNWLRSSSFLIASAPSPPVFSSNLSIDSTVVWDSRPRFDIGIPDRLIASFISGVTNVIVPPEFIMVLIITGTVCLIGWSNPANALPTPRPVTKFANLSTSFMVSFVTVLLPFALWIYVLILFVRIFLSFASGTNLLNAFDLVNPSTCLIAAAVFISTNAPLRLLKLFTSKSRLIYLPIGNTFGLVASINTPVLFLSV